MFIDPVFTLHVGCIKLDVSSAGATGAALIMKLDEEVQPEASFAIIV